MYAVHKEIRRLSRSPSQGGKQAQPGQAASASEPAPSPRDGDGAPEGLLERMHQLEARAAVRSEARRALLDRCGRLSARSRLAALLDAATPFLPLYNMASYLVDSPEPLTSLPGASVLGGIGYVAGVRCVVAVDDGGIHSGVMTAKTAQKLLGLIRVAERQGLPFVHLMDSVGPDLQQQTAVQWDELGQALAALARLRTPVVSTLHGPAIGAVALFAGLSGHVIAVRNEALVMLASAAQVRAETGEIARDAALGGAELHAEVTGLVDQLAEDDQDAIALVRAHLAGQCAPAAPEATGWSDKEPPLSAPSAAPAALAAQLADAGQLETFKPDYGAGCQCFKARIGGHAVAVLAAGDGMDADALRKAIAFLDQAEHAGRPVLFLLNSDGFALGRQAERAGLVRLAAQLMSKVAALQVPRLVLRIGAGHGVAGLAFGGLSGAMAGGGAGGVDFLFSWPQSTGGVMAPAAAGRTLEQVARRSAQRRGMALDERRLESHRADLEHHLAAQAEALARSGQGLDMGVIDPKDSRRVLRMCLDSCCSQWGRRGTG